VDLLGRVGVIPEAGLSDLLLQLFQVTLPLVEVKDAS
jgi:hypothetical protein